MRRLVFVLVTLVLAAFCFGQDDFGTDASPSRSAAKAVEIRVVDERSGLNGWGGPYTDRLLASIIAQEALEGGVSLASTTREILGEATDRDQLSANRWIDQSSPRLQPGTLIPAQVAWEVSAGGDLGSSRSNYIRVGNYTITTEAGKATMWLAVRVRDLVTGQILATIVAKGTDGSANLTSFDRQDNWFSRRGLSINWSSWDSGDPSYRRGLIASQRAIEDLRKKIRSLYSPRQEVRH